MLLICVPATIGLVLLATPLISTLFQYGVFSAYDVEMAAKSLIAFSIGLPAFVLIKVLAPGFYALKDTRTPVLVGAIAMVVNAGIALALFGPLAHVGLALATSIAGIVNAGLLYILLKKKTRFSLETGWVYFLGRVAIAGVLMALVIKLGSPEASIWTEKEALWRVSILFAWIIASALAYFAALYGMGISVHRLFERRTS